MEVIRMAARDVMVEGPTGCDDDIEPLSLECLDEEATGSCCTQTGGEGEPVQVASFAFRRSDGLGIRFLIS